MSHTAVRFLVATLLVAAAIPAQDQPPEQATSTALHAAWLREIMDLDSAGAAKDYAALVRTARPTEPARWIAVARLAELHRLGVIPGESIQVAEAPAAVRTAVAGLPPLPVEELLPRLGLDPATVLQSLGDGSTRVPPLRQASAQVLEWVRNQIGPSIDNRLRQQVPLGNRTRPDRARAERWFAADILLRELEGRQQQAASLRRFYFTDWKAPAVGGDAQQTLARVHANFDAWLAERDLSPQQATLLNNLREALAQRAATDAAAAIEFLQRMPLYADRLLAAPAATPPAKAEPTPPSEPTRATEPGRR